MNFEEIGSTGYLRGNKIHIKNKADAEYIIDLIGQLSSMKDYQVRVESPWVSVYTNSLVDVEAIADIDLDNIKYICKPPADTALSAGSIIMPNVDYEFKVTLGKTSQSHEAFLQWADTNQNVKVTRSCYKDLSNARSWGGKYFYITGKNNLLMAKMHLGGCIAKVETVIKAQSVN